MYFLQYDFFFYVILSIQSTCFFLLNSCTAILSSQNLWWECREWCVVVLSLYLAVPSCTCSIVYYNGLLLKLFSSNLQQNNAKKKKKGGRTLIAVIFHFHWWHELNWGQAVFRKVKDSSGRCFVPERQWRSWWPGSSETAVELRISQDHRWMLVPHCTQDAIWCFLWTRWGVCFLWLPWSLQ